MFLNRRSKRRTPPAPHAHRRNFHAAVEQMEDRLAPALYASGNDGTTLISIDPTTGQASTVGSFGLPPGFPAYAGAFDANDEFYTIANGSGYANLATVDLATGALSPVGSGGAVSSPLIALEGDAAGNLYAASNDGSLYAVSTVTGQFNVIGPTGFSSVLDLAFDNAGTLWGVSATGAGSPTLFQIDTATGAGTFQASITGAGASVAGLMIDPADGALYVTTYASNSALYQLDPGTGQATPVGAGLGVSFTVGGDFGGAGGGGGGNQPPIADAGGPYQISEGQSLTLDARNSFDPDFETLGYVWDVNGDGTFGDAVGDNPTLSWADLQALGIDDGFAEFDVRVQVDDGQGHVVSSAATTLTLYDTAPTATFASAGPVSEGSLATISFVNVFDPSAADTAAGFTFSYDINRDGVFDVVSSSPSETFTFQDNGLYFVDLQITDQDGSGSFFGGNVVIDNVAPENVQLNVGPVGTDGSVSVDGTFTDPGVNDPHRVLIDWGDGSPVTAIDLGPGVTGFSGVAHQYATHGNYPVTATIVDKDQAFQPIYETAPANTLQGGGFLVGTEPSPFGGTTQLFGVRFEVTALVTTGGIGGDFSTLHEGGIFGALVQLDGPTDFPDSQDLSTPDFFASVVMPVPNAAFLETELTPGWYAVVFGAGQFGASGEALADSNNLNGSPLFFYTGSYTTAWNDGGVTGSNGPRFFVAGTEPVGVAQSQQAFGTAAFLNTDPVVDSIGGPEPSPGVPGQELAFTASFSDADALDTHEVHWDFGDGAFIDFHPSTDAGALAPTHAYELTGTFTVTLTVRDNHGGSASAQTSVGISAVAVQSDPLNPGQTVLAVGGTAGADIIEVAAQGQSGRLIVVRNGVSLGLFAPVDRIAVFGGAGDDVLAVTGNVRVPAWLDGGDGDDRLHAGRGGDLLLGGAGDDVLFAGRGRDLLIGGAGADRLMSKDGSDLLIAGPTIFDTNGEALLTLAQEWARTDLDYAQRIANLRSGVGPTGSYKLNATTVLDDAVVDVLTGGKSRDWFFAAAADLITDLGGEEAMD